MISQSRLGQTLVVLLAVLLAVSVPVAALANDTEWSHTRHSNNIVDVETGGGLVISADSNDLQADDLQSGSQEWTFSLSGPDIKESDARDGRVVVVTDDGTDGDIYLLDASDGTTVNSFTGVDRFTAAARTDNTNYVADSGGSVSAFQGDALNSVGSDTPPSDAELLAASPNNVHVGTADGAIEQHQLVSGTIEQQWRTNQTFDSLTGLAATSQVVVASGTDGNANPTVAAFDRDTGAILWTHGHHSSTPQDVGISAGHVASVQGDTVISARLSDGAQVASHTKHSGSLESVAMSERYTVSGDQSSSNELISVENPASLDNPDPTDGSPGDTVTLSVDVDDPDTDDSHTVRFYNKSNGAEIGSQTFSGDGTASVSWDHDETAASDWNSTVEDSNGNVLDSTGTIGINQPDRIEIREEKQPHDLITQSLNLTVRLFSEDRVFERTTDDGQLDLSGLPDQPFIVSVRPPDGSDYVDRTMYIPDISERTTVYLLDESQNPVVEPTLLLDDVTGEFGPESVVFLEKPITTDGTTQYEPIYGERFGPDGTSAKVEAGVRYRARIISSDGQERQFEALTINSSRTITFKVSSLSQGVESTENAGVKINTTRDVSGSGGGKSKQVDFLFRDASENTTSLDLVVHEAGNASNSFASTSASAGSTPLGQFRYQNTFADSAANTTLVANVTYVQGGETIQRTVPFGVNRYPLGMPLGEGWEQIFGVGILIVLGGVFSVANARIGALLIPGVALVLWQIQLLDGVITVFGVALAFTVAVSYNLVKTSGPDGLAAQ